MSRAHGLWPRPTGLIRPRHVGLGVAPRAASRVARPLASRLRRAADHHWRRSRTSNASSRAPESEGETESRVYTSVCPAQRQALARAACRYLVPTSRSLRATAVARSGLRCVVPMFSSVRSVSTVAVFVQSTVSIDTHTSHESPPPAAPTRPAAPHTITVEAREYARGAALDRTCEPNVRYSGVRSVPARGATARRCGARETRPRELRPDDWSTIL